MEEQKSLPSHSNTASPTSRSSRAAAGASSAVGIMSAPSKDTNDGASANKGMSKLLDERMAEGAGALCNDRNGLCLGSRGDIDASKSGVYTAIAKLAGLLDGTVDGSGGSGGGGAGGRGEVPLVTIQTEDAALLVKEYGGRTVVFRCPAEVDSSSAEAADAGGQAGDEPPKPGS